MIYAHAPNRSPQERRPFQFRLRTLLVGITVFCIIAGVLGLFFRGVSRALDAEMTLQAYVPALDALTTFVQSTGMWPRDWEELIASDHGQTRGLPNSPDGLADLQSRVKVRFDLDLGDIAAMTPKTFSAVEQREPNYGTYEWRIANLLDAARKQQAARKGH
jgi:hypothetical protein